MPLMKNGNWRPLKYNSNKNKSSIQRQKMYGI